METHRRCPTEASNKGTSKTATDHSIERSIIIASTNMTLEVAIEFVFELEYSYPNTLTGEFPKIDALHLGRPKTAVSTSRLENFKL